ncbi:VOC family protein [Mycolicibacterium cosmeticum]|uniref:VOC family protein n=1 Tax=Mycolicibacterium cosmeticum TaxID=258533 RepID=UPI003D1604EA
MDQLQPVTEPKRGKVRIHLGITVDDVEEAIERVLELGGRATSERHEYPEGAVVVLQDPKVNQFCIVRYQSGATPSRDLGHIRRSQVCLDFIRHPHIILEFSASSRPKLLRARWSTLPRTLRHFSIRHFWWLTSFRWAVATILAATTHSTSSPSGCTRPVSDTTG